MSGIDIISYKLGQKSTGGGSGGGSVRLQNKTFNANGTYKADSGYDGLGTVKVAVPEEEAVLQDKTITENGTYTADAEYDGLGTVRVDVEAKLQDKTATANGSYTADSGFDGLGTVIVSVPEKEAVLEDKTITENGTYTAAAGYDGFGTVTVDVAGNGGIAAGISYDEVSSEGMVTKATVYGDRVYPYAFKGNSWIKEVVFAEDIVAVGLDAFRQSAISSINLPSTVTIIGGNAFGECSALQEIELPASLAVMEQHAFYGCWKLTTVTFKGTPTSINNYAFQSCTKLTTINVPWAEGEVANAPWGATNATINYNYTGA